MKNLLLKFKNTCKTLVNKALKALKTFFLGPTFGIYSPKVKEKDLNFFIMGVSFVFTLILFFIFRKVHPSATEVNPALNDLQYVFYGMFAFKDIGLSIATYSTILVLTGFVVVGILNIKKKYYTCISEGCSLILTGIFVIVAIAEARAFNITKDNWLLYLIMSIPLYVFIFSLAVRGARFIIKFFFVSNEVTEERKQDYTNRVNHMKKFFVRMGNYFKKNWGQVLIIIALIIFALSVLIPLFFLLTRSLKGMQDDLTYPFELPLKVTFDHYTFMWEVLKDAFMNSLITTVGVTVGTVLLASLLAFAFIRFRFPGKNIIFYLIISLMMIPGILTLLSRYQIVLGFDMQEKLVGIIIPGIAGYIPMAFMLLFTFFKGIPKDLFEAADIDGANDFTSFFRIVVPLSKPIISTIAIQTFVGEWNDYLWAKLIIGANDEIITLPVLLQSFSQSYEGMGMGAPFAGYVLSAIPLVLIFIVASKQFIEGLTSGAFKM